MKSRGSLLKAESILAASIAFPTIALIVASPSRRTLSHVSLVLESNVRLILMLTEAREFVAREEADAQAAAQYLAVRAYHEQTGKCMFCQQIVVGDIKALVAHVSQSHV